MKKISIEEVVNAIGGKLAIVGNTAVDIENRIISSVIMDSRIAEKDCLFAAIKGERVDGHKFIKNVFEAGAAAVICEFVPEDVPGVFIQVENSVKALQDLARWFRGTLKTKIVGITGSVGKTSTKEMMASVLSAKFKVQKTLGNYNNEIGLPLTVLSIDEDTEITVLEMGISDFGEMRLLSSIAKPDVCVITNIGQSHLENLGTRDGILKAKTEIFEYRNPEGPIFLNGDDDKLITVSDVAGTKPVFFGFGENNFAHPENVESLGLEGTKMTVVLGDERFDASISMIGRHMVSNAMVASAVGRYFGMNFEEINEGLKKATTISGRSNLISFGKGFIIDDCYNAAPTSMKASLDTLCLAKGIKVAILGDMFELGKDEKEMHRDCGVYAASKKFDKIIAVGNLCRNLFEGAVCELKKNAGEDEPAVQDNVNEFSDGVTDCFYFATVEELLLKLPTLVSKDMNVCVKASNGMNFKTVVEALTKM